MKQELAIVIDLGATNIQGVLISREGKVLQKETCITDDKAEDDRIWKEAVASMVSKLQAKSEQAVNTIGLSAPGIPNDDNTCIAYMPGRLAGIENFNWSDFLQQETKVVNDANAALMAEAHFGSGKGAKNIVMLTLGTGVGGSIFINGNLYQGFHQMAGHMGHITVDAKDKDKDITGTPGSLEDAIGDATVSRRSYGRFTSTRSLVKAYREGDTVATYLWLDSIQKLAVGITTICNALSPERIILGGGVVRAEEALMQPLADFMDLYEWRPGGKKTPIVIAQYQDFAGAIGAGVFALNPKI